MNQPATNQPSTNQPANNQPTLEFRDVEVSYRVRGVDRPVLRSVSFEIQPGEAYGLVGESGCGKSTVAYTALRYLPRNGKIDAGQIFFEGDDLLAASATRVAELRRSALAMVYQSPIAALNPSIRVGKQVAEAFHGQSKPDALANAEQALIAVQIADPGKVMNRYPHELSGGMAQRVVIAMALANNPRLLILDEPTTGLDATVEAEVLELIATLRAERNTSVLFISHNLGVIRQMCDRVGVLYAGQMVEQGPTELLLGSPSHPYTVGLLRCVPRPGLSKDIDRLETIPGSLPSLGTRIVGCVYADRCSIATSECHTEQPPLLSIGDNHQARCWHHEQAPQVTSAVDMVELTTKSNHHGLKPDLLTVQSLSKTFTTDDTEIRVLNNISLTLKPGETLGLVGESGSGKTTFAKTLLGLIPPDAGTTLELSGRKLAPTLNDRSAKEIGAVQIVFQNPDSALNRRHSVRRIVARAVEKLGGVNKSDAQTRAAGLLSDMRVDARLHGAKPVMLSGGLKQRVAIARAFAGNPELVVCDEPTSALDVSVQAAILNLLVDLQRKNDVAYIFISHDLGVVRYISDRIAVLYLGRIMELGPANVVFSAPHHPYTEALIASLPGNQIEGQERTRLTGDVPSVASPPSGCVLHTRCPRRANSGVEELCATVEPDLIEVAPDHFLRCHIAFDQLAEMQRALDVHEQQLVG